MTSRSIAHKPIERQLAASAVYPEDEKTRGREDLRKRFLAEERLLLDDIGVQLERLMKSSRNPAEEADAAQKPPSPPPPQPPPPLTVAHDAANVSTVNGPGVGWPKELRMFDKFVGLSGKDKEDRLRTAYANSGLPSRLPTSGHPKAASADRQAWRYDIKLKNDILVQRILNAKSKIPK